MATSSTVDLIFSCSFRFRGESEGLFHPHVLVFLVFVSTAALPSAVSFTAVLGLLLVGVAGALYILCSIQ